VNMSAACSSVLMYSIRAESSLKISDRQHKLTLCVLVIWRSLGLYPFFTTRIVARLRSVQATAPITGVRASLLDKASERDSLLRFPWSIRSGRLTLTNPCKREEGTN